MFSVPLVCLPIALALVYVPKIPLSLAMAREGKGYDNRTPRDQQARLVGWGKRALAAHQNGFESFPAFAAGVLATLVTGADPHLASAFSITYVVARALYAVFYIADIATLRSVVWIVGLLATVGLLTIPIFAV